MFSMVEFGENGATIPLLLLRLYGDVRLIFFEKMYRLNRNDGG